MQSGRLEVLVVFAAQTRLIRIFGLPFVLLRAFLALIVYLIRRFAIMALLERHSRSPRYQRRVPKVLRTPTVIYRPHGPLLPKSASPRYLSREPSRSNRKCWVTRNSNPLLR